MIVDRRSRGLISSSGRDMESCVELTLSMTLWADARVFVIPIGVRTCMLDRMAHVLQLTKRIVDRPIVEHSPPFPIRTFRGVRDVDLWLRLHAESLNRGGAGEPLQARAWDVNDFRREFLEKSWWHPWRMWLAETAGEAPGGPTTSVRPDSRPVQRSRDLAGSVTLGVCRLSIIGSSADRVPSRWPSGFTKAVFADRDTRAMRH